ncbi:S8 family serine peptidase [Nocardioides pyridinolyticus]
MTFTGPFGALHELHDGWDRLRTARAMYLEPPQMGYLGHLESERPFDDRAPAVARVHHKWELGVPVAERLQAEMILHQLPILVEAEHRVGLSAGGGPGGGGGIPSVALDPAALAAVDTDAVKGSAPGPRVAVIDTGDLLGKPTMSDFTGGLAGPMPADDVVGHGTAVAEVIRQVNTNSDVSALRAVNAQKGGSYELLCAMTYALWSGMFDVVNVSLSAQGTNTCMTVLGGSLDMVLDICHNNGVIPPQIVAAAGNTTTGQAFGYPASLPGSTVVQAWDFSRSPTTYNVAVPSTHQPVHATGGDAADTFGTITDGAGNVEPIYGTSFAAAVATALLVP